MRKFLGWSLLLLMPGSALGQITGTISGVVSDQAGAVLPGVSITIESPSLLRGSVTVVSDDEGRFAAPGLQAGVYSLRAELSGFATETVSLAGRGTVR